MSYFETTHRVSFRGAKKTRKIINKENTGNIYNRKIEEKRAKDPVANALHNAYKQEVVDNRQSNDGRQQRKAPMMTTIMQGDYYFSKSYKKQQERKFQQQTTNMGLDNIPKRGAEKPPAAGRRVKQIKYKRARKCKINFIELNKRTLGRTRQQMEFNCPNAAIGHSQRRFQEAYGKEIKRQHDMDVQAKRRASQTGKLNIRPMSARPTTSKKTTLHQRPQSARSSSNHRRSSLVNSDVPKKTARPRSARPSSARSKTTSIRSRPQSALTDHESIYSATSSRAVPRRRRHSTTSSTASYMQETKASLFRRGSAPVLIPAPPGIQGQKNYTPANRHDQVVTNANRVMYPPTKRLRPRRFYKTEPDFAPVDPTVKPGAGFFLRNHVRPSAPRPDGIVVAVHSAKSTPARAGTKLGTAAQHYTVPYYS